MVAALHVDDAGFVRAPEARCYRVLTHVAAWPSFWPATAVVDHGGDRFTVTAGRRPRRLRLAVAAGGWRHDAGFTMRLGGDLVGRWEVWLEPGWGGTVVHHVVAAPGTSMRRRRHLRRWLRTGLWGLKDLLQEEGAAT